MKTTITGAVCLPEAALAAGFVPGYNRYTFPGIQGNDAYIPASNLNSTRVTGGRLKSPVFPAI